MKRLIAILLLPATAQGQLPDWPVAVGGNPSRNGLSAVDGPATKNLVWSGGRSAVIAQQGVAWGNRFVVSRIFDVNNVQGGTDICCYDVATGTEVWRRQLPVDFPSSDWRSKTSAVRDGVVYATRAGNTNAAYLYALNLSDGSIKWRSTDLIDETTTEGVSFAANGDIIAGSLRDVKRIRATDGTTVWTVSRFSPTSDGSNVAVFGSRGYTWEAGPNGPQVVAIDLETGTIAHRSPGIGGGFVQQLGLMVGRDGTVYAPRTQNNALTDFFVALTDTGNSFVEKWRYPMGYTPFGSHAVRPDGSVYAYARTSPPSIVRLNPDTGAEISNSGPVPTDFSQPRIAIDAAGRVFFTNGGFSQGGFFSFNADLTLRWQEAILNVNLGGPVICADGTVIVCGVGSNIRAYRDPAGITPDQFSVLRGVLEQGGLAELGRSDDQYLIVRNGPTLNPNAAPIQVQVEGTATVQNPSALSFTLETRVSTAGLEQQVLLFNWQTNAFVQVDARSATTTDRSITVQAQDPGQFVQSGTRRVRSLVRFRRVGPTQSSNYRAFFDLTRWDAQP